MRALVPVVLLAGLVTCASAPHPTVTPPAPTTVRCPACMRFPAPLVYRRWWANVEQCSGFQGRMDRLTWYVAPLPILAFSDTGARYLAYYFGGPDPMVIFGLSQEADSTVVEHEMLHALMDQNGVTFGDDPHPLVERTRCGAQLRNWG